MASFGWEDINHGTKDDTALGGVSFAPNLSFGGFGDTGKNQNSLLLVGGVVLIGLAIYLMRSK